MPWSFFEMDLQRQLDLLSYDEIAFLDEAELKIQLAQLSQLSTMGG